MSKCKKCGGEWEIKTEQAVCIDLFGVCIECKDGGLTSPEMRRVMDEAASRGIYTQKYSAAENEGV